MAKILVIEDEIVLRELVRDELVKAKFDVIEAKNGREGWDLLNSEKPDLILLDLLMPVMNGYDFLIMMHDNAALRDIPCMVISNSGQSSDMNRAFELGAKEVLIKAEFNPDQVVDKVKKLLNITEKNS